MDGRIRGGQQEDGRGGGERWERRRRTKTGSHRFHFYSFEFTDASAGEKHNNEKKKKFDLNNRTQRQSRLRSNRPIRDLHFLLPWGQGRLQLKVRTD